MVRRAGAAPRGIRVAVHVLDRLLWWGARLFPAAPAAAWLDAVPRGKGPIGPSWPARHAAERGLALVPAPDGGLVPDLGALSHVGPVHPRIRAFYEHTARFALSIDVRWRGPLHLAAAVWAAGWGRRWGQLELPAASDVALTNEVFALQDGDRAEGTLWLRCYAGTDRALYVSRYDVVAIDGSTEPVVRITFPVPGGAWVVVFRAEAWGEGGLLLTEEGGEPGGAGLYLVPDGGPARYVRALREAIAVSATAAGVDAVHTFDLWGVRILELRYGIPLAEGAEG